MGVGVKLRSNHWRNELQLKDGYFLKKLHHPPRLAKVVEKLPIWCTFDGFFGELTFLTLPRYGIFQ